MEIEAQKIQNVRTSDCQSLRGSQYQSGRFRKVSIGITVDKSQNIGSDHAGKDHWAALPSLRKNSLSQDKVIEQRNIPVTIGIVEEIQVENEKQAFEFRPKLIPALQPEEGAGKKSDVVYEKSDSRNTRRVEGTASAAKQEMHFVDERATEKSEKMSSCNTEALRMKLWEILGVAPEDKQISNSSSPDDSFKHSNIDPKDKSHMADAAKHKNSDTIEDDTESPDQTERRPLTRSLTRKKAATKTVPKLQQEVNRRRKLLSSPSSVMKLKFQKNIFSFDEREGRAGRSERAIKGQSPSSNRKKTERKKAGIDPHKKFFPQLSHPESEKPLQTNGKQQIVKAAYKATSGSKNAGNPSCRPCQSKDFSGTYETKKSSQTLQKSNEVLKDSQASHVDARENVNSKEMHENADKKAITSAIKGLKSPVVARNGNSHAKPTTPPQTRNTDRVDDFRSPMSPNAKTSSFEGLKIPSVPRNGNSQMRPTSPSPGMRNADPVDDLQSPTLAMDGTSPLSTSKTPDNEPFNSGQARPNFFGRRLFSSRSSDDSRQSGRLDMQTESSDNSGETFGHASKEKETERQLSVSPTEEQDAWSFEANVAANKGFKHMDGNSGRACSTKKHLFSLRRTKRFYSLEDLTIGKIEPSSPAPTAPSGTHETTMDIEDSDLYPEDSLARETIQLALVIEKFKAKIKSHTSKKSSQILSSAADKLFVKLQDVESEIQTDLVKFAGVSKLKRKQLESRFEEQQDQLMVVHDKFKEDVNQHLLDYKKTIEEFQTDQKEVKANLERQKASHKKLLLQVEDQMKVQLHDAETNIFEVQKEARKKMKDLKHVLREFIQEGGMFS